MKEVKVNYNKIENKVGTYIERRLLEKHTRLN